MTSKPTNYYRPATRDEALALVGEPDAIAVAGGALLFGRLELPYTTVIDLQDVPELNEIAADEHGVTIGAAVRLQDVVESDDVPAFLKRSLTRALPLNIRNGASVGESLMLDQPPREWLAALVAHDAGVLRLLPDGQPAADGIASLMDGSSPHPLRTGLLTGIFIPSLGPREAHGAAYVSRTPADEAIVNAAVHVQLNEAGLVDAAFAALCGASAQPVISLYLDTLTGNALNEANIHRAADSVPARVEPVSDFLGSAEYRCEMARVTVKRALLEAASALGVL